MENTMFADVQDIQADVFDLDVKEEFDSMTEELAQHPSLGTCFCTAVHNWCS